MAIIVSALQREFALELREHELREMAELRSSRDIAVAMLIALALENGATNGSYFAMQPELFNLAKDYRIVMFHDDKSGELQITAKRLDE